MTRRIVVLAATGLVAGLLALLGPVGTSEASAAAVATGCNGYSCGSDDDASGSGSGSTRSSSATRVGGSGTCSVFANGAGMGSYCASGGAGNAQTLRERFGGKGRFVRCRYTVPPPSIPVPFNSRPNEGKWWLRTCLENVDYDTVTGGADRSLSMRLAWVPNDFDTNYVNTPLSEFLWKQFAKTAKLPVPFMQTWPNSIPIVGVPTFFTFRWIDPDTKQPIKQGDYTDDPDGGPFVQIDNNGLLMQARAVDIEINPNQTDMSPVDCGPGNPRYVQGASVADQPSKCRIDFSRSSATARAKTTQPIPAVLGDVYHARLTVTWEVRYGTDKSNLKVLGDDFKMTMLQPIQVREIQAPNQPPVAIY